MSVSLSATKRELLELLLAMSREDYDLVISRSEVPGSAAEVFVPFLGQCRRVLYDQEETLINKA